MTASVVELRITPFDCYPHPISKHHVSGAVPFFLPIHTLAMGLAVSPRNPHPCPVPGYIGG